MTEYGEYARRTSRNVSKSPHFKGLIFHSAIAAHFWDRKIL